MPTRQEVKSHRQIVTARRARHSNSPLQITLELSCAFTIHYIRRPTGRWSVPTAQPPLTVDTAMAIAISLSALCSIFSVLASMSVIGAGRPASSKSHAPNMSLSMSAVQQRGGGLLAAGTSGPADLCHLVSAAQLPPVLLKRPVSWQCSDA